MILYFCKGSDWVSNTIKFFGMSPYNHCAVQINGCIYEATFKKGVFKTDFAEFTSRYPNRDLVILHPINGGEKQAQEWLEEQVGKGYDFTGILGLQFQRNWQAEDKWFCSELIAGALIKAGVLRLRIPVNGISVRDLDISRKMGWVI